MEMCKDYLINLLLDNMRVPTNTLIALVEKADTNKDGFISMRELYDAYREWRDDDA